MHCCHLASRSAAFERLNVAGESAPLVGLSLVHQAATRRYARCSSSVRVSCRDRLEQTMRMDARVLIVDSDAGVRSELSALLTMRECVVRTARNGQEALDELERFQPSLVMLEMRLPLLDGWGLAREV